MVRSTSSTASGSSVTRWRAASMAARKVGNWQMPSALRGLIGQSLQIERGGEGQRAFAADQQPRQVAAARGARGRGQRIDVVAADAAQLLGKRAAISSASRAPSARRRWIRSAMPGGHVRRRGCPAARRSGSACHRRAWRRSPARCRPSARSGWTCEPQELLPAMPPMVQRARSRDRPGRTACARFSASFSAPRVMPGCTVARAARRDRP